MMSEGNSVIAAIHKDIDGADDSITRSNSLQKISGNGDKVADSNELQVADSNSLPNNIAVTAGRTTDEEGLTTDPNNSTTVNV